MACKQCGHCCSVCDMTLDELTEKNADKALDKLRWLNLHRCDAQVRTRKDGKKFTVLRIPLICTKLDIDKEGKYFCKDYENRPQICRDFLCERARKD